MVMTWLWVAFTGCVEPPSNPAPAFNDPGALDGSRLLVRWSLDLRGVRPSEAELDALWEGETELDDFLDQFLEDERFGDRVMDLYSEKYRTRTEYFTTLLLAYGADEGHELWKPLGEEPLRILREIALHDLPYTELVTGDWTMGTEELASFWPLESIGEPDSQGWQRMRYTDGRPAVGVLATNSLWWRYGTTNSNANRGRANVISELMLCFSFLDRDVDFNPDLNLLDEEAVKESIKTDPNCMACHVTLDPLASYLFGFHNVTSGSAVDSTVYHPEREAWWDSYTEVTPSFFGEPAPSLSYLGAQIASDPRFVSCPVEQVTSSLWRRDLALADTEALTVHREAFLSGGLTLRSLFRSVVSGPRYQGYEAVDGTELKILTPLQQSQQVEELTGYQWTSDGNDVLATDIEGLRILAGGMDGYAVREMASKPPVTLPLVQERLAEAAAEHAFTLWEAGEPPPILDGLDASLPTQDSSAELWIQTWFLRALSRAPTAEESEGLLELIASLSDELGETIAWRAGLTAVLRHPEFVLY